MVIINNKNVDLTMEASPRFIMNKIETGSSCVVTKSSDNFDSFGHNNN